ncbi:histone-lysine N-methyltransferase SETMAR-like [Homalodisca vitripennis]|uniref:histone-lysine N-methyltransferase SETMAR-like n=1 Tax=Homalodisca vitripennis TaxID=197043 RepID=UPI001EEB1B21|nr:histone-lysine N-methyltransferase SETMAR-like [Homalodisca vitripennis]
MLMEAQKKVRGSCSEELLELIRNDSDILNSILIGNESWMFEYDPESKRQSSDWHTQYSPKPKKGRMRKTHIKIMLVVFFDVRGIIHFEFVLQGHTANTAFYLEVLKRLKRRVVRVRPNIKDYFKLHHNVPSHTAFIVINYLTQNKTPVVPKPPYSSDLGPLFPLLKREL